MPELIVCICPVCKGFGKIEQNELTDFHHRYLDYWDEPCSRCKGSGRMITETHNLNGTDPKYKNCITTEAAF